MASKSRKNRVKFKLTKELIFLLSAIVIIIVAAIVWNLPTNAAVQLEKYNKAIQTYNTTNSTSYNQLTADHVYKEISLNGLKNKKNSDKYTYVWYGVLTDGSYLEQLQTINTTAKEYEVKTVYLFFATYVDSADTDKRNSVAYRDELKAKEAKLNDKVNQDQDDFDMEIYPTLLVFKSGELIFNSQTYSESDNASEYGWKQYINKAFSYEKNSEIEE